MDIYIRLSNEASTEDVTSFPFHVTDPASQTFKDINDLIRTGGYLDRPFIVVSNYYGPCMVNDYDYVSVQLFSQKYSSWHFNMACLMRHQLDLNLFCKRTRFFKNFNNAPT